MARASNNSLSQSLVEQSMVIQDERCEALEQTIKEKEDELDKMA